MDGYIRVSRKMGRSGPGYISPSVQRDAIQRWADYRGVEIAKWHFDEDQSGGTQDRPGLREVLERIDAGETDGIACWRLNRFARNVDGAIRDVKRIQAAGGSLAFVEEDIDPTGPFGTFILTILLAVATLERDNIVAGLKEARRRAVERGAYPSRTPLGYLRGESSVLVPDPETAPIVREAFRLAASDGQSAAMAYLRQALPGMAWTASTVRRLLERRAYLGEVRSTGDGVNPSGHDELVTRALWEAAQAAPRKKGRPGTYPLSGLLECGTCGGPMYGGFRRDTSRRMYRCHNRSRTCMRTVVVNAQAVERVVFDAARGLLRGLRITDSDPDAPRLAELERLLAEAEAELDAFATDLTARRRLGANYHRYLQARVDAVDQAQAVYRETAANAHQQHTVSAAAILDGDDVQLQQALLRGLFARVVIASAAPGRPAEVKDRVRFFPVDTDGPSAVTAP